MDAVAAARLQWAVRLLSSVFDQLLQCAWRKLALSTAALKKTDQSTGEVGPVWRNNQESSTFQSLTPRRNLCTFRLYFQVIFLFTKAVSMHELRNFSNT